VPRSSYFWKLFGGYAALIVGTCLLLGVLAGLYLERAARRQSVYALQVAAELLVEPARTVLTTGDAAALNAALGQLGARTGTRLTIIRADGTVLADSAEPAAQMDNHLDRPEIRAALTGGVGEAARFSTTIGQRMMYVAVRVTGADGQLLGFTRAALPLTAVAQQQAALRRSLWLTTAVAAMLALLLALAISRSLARPLLQLAAATEVLAADPAGTEAGPPDEIVQLDRAVRRMSLSLSERLETIEKDRQQLLAILGGMVEGVIAVDAAERVVHMNGAAGTMLGIDAQRQVGSPLYEIVRVTALIETLRSAMQLREPVIAEMRLFDAARESVVELYASPLVDSRGATSGAVVVLHDVTELRRLEGVRRDFVANVSHELKTPLAVVKAVVETMLDEDDMDVDIRRKFLGKVDDQSRRLIALVDDLLSLSRVESQMGTEGRIRLDLRLVVQSAVSALMPAAEARAVTVRTQLGDEPLAVFGDEEALRQALTNLIDNAIKYSRDGGSVEVRGSVEDQQVIVTVSDDGVGIPADEQDRVFERFYRVDKARSREVGGTGLGLSIVKHVALSHGGSVSVSSSLGQGSSFRIELPASTAQS
jgi:two-component system phosphate regulon sensor histidine kinase PhoR